MKTIKESKPCQHLREEHYRTGKGKCKGSKTTELGSVKNSKWTSVTGAERGKDLWKMRSGAARGWIM